MINKFFVEEKKRCRKQDKKNTEEKQKIRILLLQRLTQVGARDFVLFFEFFPDSQVFRYAKVFFGTKKFFKIVARVFGGRKNELNNREIVQPRARKMSLSVFSAYGLSYQ